MSQHKNPSVNDFQRIVERVTNFGARIPEGLYKCGRYYDDSDRLTLLKSVVDNAISSEITIEIHEVSRGLCDPFYLAKCSTLLPTNDSYHVLDAEGLEDIASLVNMLRGQHPPPAAGDGGCFLVITDVADELEEVL